MKIINDTKVFEPNECIFAIDEDDDGVIVSIVDREHWNREHRCNDGIVPDTFSNDVNDAMENAGLFDVMEGTWESDSTVEETRKAMLAMGFEESQELTDFLDGNGYDQ